MSLANRQLSPTTIPAGFVQQQTNLAVEAGFPSNRYDALVSSENKEMSQDASFIDCYVTISPNFNAQSGRRTAVRNLDPVIVSAQGDYAIQRSA